MDKYNATVIDLEETSMLNEVLLNPDHQIFGQTVPLKIMHIIPNDGVPVVLEDYGHLRDCVIPCMF
jgi:hypothetical protein